MNLSIRPVLGRVVLLAAALVAAGCQITRKAEPPPPPPAPPPIEAPLATHKFRFDPKTDEVVGEVQITHVQGEDTLPDIARRFNVGYEELLRANPGVDPWLPGVGRAIVVPTQFVLPKGPRDGLVVNLAQLRVFYFPKPPKLKKGEVDDGMRTVITHPIGIGKVGWETPVGTTKVVSKQKNPTWTPPLSVRKEHKEAGDPLPARVPPGPDNPLGAYKMVLGWPSYLIHGTNKPYGVGMRSSHGCIRFYPEDIAELYDQIPVGTKVTVVNQPFVFGWHRGELYAQVFPILEDDEREHPEAAEALLNTSISDEMRQKLEDHDVAVDLELVNAMVKQRRGISMPVSRRDVTIESYLAEARHVENRVPEGATWNYTEEGLFLAEEFEAVRNGLPLPKKKTAPQDKKTAAKPAGAASGS
ncbi:MAG TPA: L,D-transpeptidase family protein [Steroidobacter sp.]|uniref:L,D-transpeptidase family protein n=1 Tax=Steroidobacter sp. TaxID=1978227 RepID=UPI002EDA8829